jgi:hypothetical protein
MALQLDQAFTVNFGEFLSFLEDNKNIDTSVEEDQSMESNELHDIATLK